VTISPNPCTLTTSPSDGGLRPRLATSHYSQRLSTRPLSTTREIVRVGAVSYLNSKPLIHGLCEDLGDLGIVTTDLPSRLADQLMADKIDVGLIPVFEFLRTPGLRLVSQSAIISRGPVWSVRLFFRTAPDQVTRVAMDEGSRTSVALSKVLLNEVAGRIPETIPLAMDDDPEDVDADAILLIGDRAMHPERFANRFLSNWDLGEKWKDLTGLPFVFAAWVTRDATMDSIRLSDILDATRRRGVAAIPQIARDCASQYGLDASRCIDYLTNYIFFELDKEANRGLEEFRRRCHHLGLIPNHALS
jgi:chorismate dehydratase